MSPVERIASGLCDELEDRASWQIVPLGFDIGFDERAAISTAWRSVRELKRQRDGLKDIWPEKWERWQREFNEKVMEIAVDLHDQLANEIPLSLIYSAYSP